VEEDYFLFNDYVIRNINLYNIIYIIFIVLFIKYYPYYYFMIVILLVVLLIITSLLSFKPSKVIHLQAGGTTVTGK